MENADPYGHLVVLRKNGKDVRAEVPVVKKVFVIGRSEDNTDLCIPNELTSETKQLSISIKEGNKVLLSRLADVEVLHNGEAVIVETQLRSGDQITFCKRKFRWTSAASSENNVVVPKAAKSYSDENKPVQPTKPQPLAMRPANQRNSPARERKEDKGMVLVTKGKTMEKEGDTEGALKVYKEAMAYFPENLQLKKRIAKLEVLVSEGSPKNLEILSSCEDYSVNLSTGAFHLTSDPAYVVPKHIFDNLYDYQRVGVRWMLGRYIAKEGGILGDDMGLGKTFQTVAFVSSLLFSRKAKTVLIICPLSIIEHWKTEFGKRSPNSRLRVYHGSSKGVMDNHLWSVGKKGGIILTTYGMANSRVEDLQKISWNLVVLDEGHKLKNSSNKGSKAIRSLTSRCRMLLTGTVVQNNLKELWSLFHYVQPDLFDTYAEFLATYEGPIVRGSSKDATQVEKDLSVEMGSRLRKKTGPYYLRRLKKDVLGNSAPQTPSAVRGTLTSRKNDLILWVTLSPKQIEIYDQFLTSEQVAKALNKTNSPLAALTVLKKLCDHPLLLTNYHSAQLRKHFAEADLHENDIWRLAEWSGKLRILIVLLKELKEKGHRTLIFSQSRMMLDLTEGVMRHLGLTFLRIDGTISKTEIRQQRIEKFNTDKSIDCFVLTSQVGSLGITLTGADRVVIFDPHWNPAMDNQAVDRAYRIGQEKNVVVYRLITCGTIEEKIYRKQIFKGALKNVADEDTRPFRYFTKQELKELFRLDDPSSSRTQQQLERLQRGLRDSDRYLDEHLEFLQGCGIIGISDHDLLYSKQVNLRGLEEDYGPEEENDDWRQDMGIADAHPSENDVGKDEYSFEISDLDSYGDRANESGEDVSDDNIGRHLDQADNVGDSDIEDYLSDSSDSAAESDGGNYANAGHGGELGEPTSSHGDPVSEGLDTVGDEVVGRVGHISEGEGGDHCGVSGADLSLVVDSEDQLNGDEGHCSEVEHTGDNGSNESDVAVADINKTCAHGGEDDISCGSEMSHDVSVGGRDQGEEKVGTNENDTSVSFNQVEELTEGGEGEELDECGSKRVLFSTLTAVCGDTPKTNEQIQSYNDNIDLGRMCIEAGDYEEGAEALLDALDIYDGDEKLHLKLLWLMRELSIAPKSSAKEQV